MPNIEFIQALLICSSLVAVGATIPQLKKLIKVKSSREFNINSYMMWIGTQSVNVAYMVSIGDVMLVVVSSSWLTYYIVMVSLIIYYRRPKHSSPLEIEPELITKDNLPEKQPQLA